MITMPKRNLAPESEPWGRKVDERLDTIEKTSSKNQQDTSNAESAINSTVTKLSEQVAAIDLLTQRLASQQATLEAQQATLANQQSQLSEQVAQISNLIGAQIQGQTLTSSQYATYNNTYQDYATVTFTAPAGYSRAYVMGVCSASFDPLGADGANAALHVKMGVEMSNQQASQTSAGAAGTITASYADFFSLDPGEQFTVSAYAINPNGQGWVQTSAIAIFLR